MPDCSYGASWTGQLEQRLAVPWPAISKARQDTREKRLVLDELFITRSSPDASLVVFGSVARQEVTERSDLDWILLIDGQCASQHKKQELAIESTLAGKGHIKPGKSGVFGKMVGSHDLVHNIGGEDDSNFNTTRRVLFLLESLPIGEREAYDRVRRQILQRYLEDDRGLCYSSGPVRVPRFLLNDLTRYWRTVTVDFVYKQRADKDNKWALRNAKLRMSRKLIFAAGLLQCFFCQLDEEAQEARYALQHAESRGVSLLLEYLEKQLALPPLDIVAKACLLPQVRRETALAIFTSYDRFLTLLNDPDKRTELEMAHTHDHLRHSETWREVSSISHTFHKGLVSLFLQDNEQLSDLTMQYGVF